jgi:hypothetical protein
MRKLLILLLFPSLSFATNYYYANTTSGTNAGTQANPFHGLSAVQSNMSLFNAGDSILAKRGDTFSGTLTVSRSGSSGNPIVFGAYGTGADPQFIGTGSTISYLFYTNNRSWIVFTNLKITDPTINPADSSEVSKIQRAFTFDGSSNNITIKNCFIELAGVGAYWPSGNHTMTDCEVTNLRMVVSSGSGDYGSNPLVIESSNNTVTRNYFHDCIAQSVEFGYDGGAVEFYAGGISGNVVTYNRIENCLVLSEFGSGSGGTISNTVYAYNRLINNGCTFYVNTSGGFAVSISNIQLYNNTIVEQRQNVVGDTYMIGLQTAVGTAGQIVMKNNIFYLRSGIDVCRSGQFTGSQLTHTNNLYNLGSGSVLNFTLGGTEKSESASIWQSQSDANAINWNYQLLSNSSARGMGTNVGFATDYAGKAVPSTPDAGIYQFQTGQTTVITKGIKFLQ